MPLPNREENEALLFAAMRVFRQLFTPRLRNVSGALFHPWAPSSRLVHGAGVYLGLSQEEVLAGYILTESGDHLLTEDGSSLFVKES